MRSFEKRSPHFETPRMADDPPSPTKPPASDRDPRVLRRRVGAWVKARRIELGLSQGAMIRELGYVSRNSVSNIETGREGLPTKRVYDWADLLRVPRDAFFHFVRGETLEVSGATDTEPAARVSQVEADLLSSYRKLAPPAQRRVRDLVKELSRKDR